METHGIAWNRMESIAWNSRVDRHLRPPFAQGCLLHGPSGCAKTLLARAVSGEAGVPFFSCSGSDFVELYVGSGSLKVRTLFAKAKRAAPALIFIDEIDAVGRERYRGGGPPMGGNDERENTVNQVGAFVTFVTHRPQ